MMAVFFAWAALFVKMRIENDVKLDFKDVLIRPKRSTLKSRSQVHSQFGILLFNSSLRGKVDLSRTYSFKHSNRTWTGVPIMAANMFVSIYLGLVQRIDVLYVAGTQLEPSRWRPHLTGILWSHASTSTIHQKT